MFEQAPLASQMSLLKPSENTYFQWKIGKIFAGWFYCTLGEVDLLPKLAKGKFSLISLLMLFGWTEKNPSIQFKTKSWKIYFRIQFLEGHFKWKFKTFSLSRNTWFAIYPKWRQINHSSDPSLRLESSTT